METLSKHPRAVFWARMLGWFGIGCATPIAVFAAKFGLFKATPTTDALGNVISDVNVSLNGWGIVACLILGSYLTNILREVADANEGYSLTKQCYDGIAKTMPLIILYVVCYFLSGVLSQAMYCLAWVIVCRLVSTPLNPLPKWKYEKKGVEDYNDALSYLTTLVKRRKDGET